MPNWVFVWVYYFVTISRSLFSPQLSACINRSHTIVHRVASFKLARRLGTTITWALHARISHMLHIRTVIARPHSAIDPEKRPRPMDGIKACIDYLLIWPARLAQSR